MEEDLPEELKNFADIEVGGLLRRTREHYRQSLQDIEHALRIRASQIDAIERGDISVLPGRVYAIGFVRTYAEYLGLDGDKIVYLFKAQYMDAAPSGSELVFPVAAADTKTPAAWLVFLSVLAALTVLVAWGMRTYHAREQNTRDIPEVPAQVTERLQGAPALTPVDRDESFASEGFAESPAPGEAQKGIVLNILERSWVEIKDETGKTVVGSVLEPGDQYFVPDSPGLTMSLGNAGGVEVILDGKALMPLGLSGSVQKDIPLDTSYLGTLEFRAETPTPDEDLLESPASIDDKEPAQSE